MKKTIFSVLLASVFSLMTSIPAIAQSTEGKDFWVTMMRADSDNPTNLSLTISAKDAANVKVENPHTGYNATFSVAADGIYRLENLNSNDCYVGSYSDVEKASKHALHVTSDQPISLIAANYRDKSFDVAAVLPTSAVRSEYRIMCYTPTAHSDGAQGTHFAIVATEDNTVVDITPTVATYSGHPANVTYQSDTLKQGEVFYVWTGNGSGDSYDLSGTKVKAQANKKIAVFNGNPHTNIPNAIRDRDHIYSQAMPIQYWGTQFAIMSSVTTIDGQTGVWERIDKIRVMALTDGTTIYIDGDSITTIDFASNPKGFYEFDFGAKDQMTNYSGDGHRYFPGSSHYIETSCPAAVHQFFTSDRYDHSSGKYCNGDPSELWVNPIEQNIDEITFATFQTAQVKDHFINIVTKKENVSSVTLDGNNLSSRFGPLTGNTAYSFARMSITDGTHTLKADSGFIANVYGFGEKESYAFPAGAHTKDLTSAIIINGDTFSLDKQSTLCGEDDIHFACSLNYAPKAIKWGFGDGTDTTIVNTKSSNTIEVDHYYAETGTYHAYAQIVREFDTNCYGEADIDSIPIRVTIGRMNFEVDTLVYQCGQPKIYYKNVVGIELTKDILHFDAASKRDGFTDESIVINEKDSCFEFTIPDINILSNEKRKANIYRINLHVANECDVLDKNIDFRVPLIPESIMIIGGDTVTGEPMLLCGKDTIGFAIDLNYVPTHIELGFGDGTKDSTILNIQGAQNFRFDHYYSKAGIYEAYARIYHAHDITCPDEHKDRVDTIQILATIDRLDFETGTLRVPCGENAQLPYNNISGMWLTRDMIHFSDNAIRDGFKDEDILINSDSSRFEFAVPDGISDEKRLATSYAIHLKIKSVCDSLDKDFPFMLPISNDVIEQRYTYALGLKKDKFDGYTLENFEWTKVGDTLVVSRNAVLNLKDNANADYEAEYIVCYDIRKNGSEEVGRNCSCPMGYDASIKEEYLFEELVEIQISYIVDAGGKLYINAAKDATAQWIDINGMVVRTDNIPAGGCAVAAPGNGFYVLRVIAEEDERNFKVMVNQ